MPAKCSQEFGLGSPEGFQFNMSVGYDLDGIKTEKIDRFIEGMKDASETAIFQECRQWLLDNLDRFDKVSREDVEAISQKVCNCATLSTLHGCPPQEIERIARYLIEEKKVHTFIKCNPTLLGYEYARKIMDDMGYDYVAFGDFILRMIYSTQTRFPCSRGSRPWQTGRDWSRREITGAVLWPA